MGAEVVISADRWYGNLPIRWGPFGVDIHLGVVDVIRVKFFTCEKNLAVEVMVKSNKRFIDAACGEARCWAEFKTEAKKRAKVEGRLG